MGFPESVLTSDEQVVLHLHPHWKALVRPVAALVIIIAALIAAWMVLPGAGWSTVALLVLGGIALVLAVWLVVWPWLKWRATHYVFTNERVIMREGVFSRNGRDIPLGRINDVSFRHNFFERMLGCGTLTIESAGERGQVVLQEIPHVERVQTRLYELTEAVQEAHAGDEADDETLARELPAPRDVARDRRRRSDPPAVNRGR